MAEAGGGGSEAKLKLEVVSLTQELTVQLLNKRPQTVTDIYSCCADYLGRQIEQRNASKRRANAAAAAAWAERSVMKQRQVAFENPIQVAPAQGIQRRVQSAPNPQHRGLPPGEADSSDTEESDSDSVKNAESDSAKEASVRKETQQTIIDAPSDFEDRDSGFHASEGLSESTAKSETFGSSILSPSSSLLSTSIGTVTCETPRPCTSSTLIEVGSAQREEPIEEDDTLEDDLCTFAFFKDTTERNQDQSSENGKPRQLTAPNRTSECMPRRQHQSHVLTLAGHESAVTQCRVCDTFIATSSRDGTVRIWSVQTGKLLRTLNCKRPVHDFLLVFYRCKWPYLVVCCEDGGILVIKVHEDKATGQIKLTMGGEYTGHLPNPIRSVAMSPSRLDLATGCCFTMNQITRKGRAILVCRGTLKTWDLDTMLKSAEDGVAYEGAPVAVRTMRRLVATGIRRTPGIDGEEVTYGLRALAYSPDGALLVVGFGHPEDAGLWDTHLLVILCAKSMNTLWIEKAHLCQVTRAEFLPTPKGNRIRHGGPHHLILSTFNRMALLSIKQDEQKVSVEYIWIKKFDQPHFGSVTTSNGKMAASCLGMDIQFRACASGSQFERLENAHDGWVKSVCFSPDSSHFVSVGADGSIKLWRSPNDDHLTRPDVDRSAKKRTTAASGSGASKT